MLLPAVPEGIDPTTPKFTSTLARVSRYAAVKFLSLLAAVVVGLYLTIFIVNLGGFVDKVFSSYIDEGIGMRILGGWLKDTPEPERTAEIEKYRTQMAHALGLDQPFLLRTVRWLWEALRLNLGHAFLMINNSEVSGTIQEIVLRLLPYTLLLVGASNALFFIASVGLSLSISRRIGGLLDRLSVLLSVFTNAPSWIIGILLTVVLVWMLHWLPFARPLHLDLAGEPTYFKMVLSALVIPVMAIFISMFFQSVYAWRTYFLIYSGEDYVELARAKGLSEARIQRRYLLRPTLPYVLTTFVTMMLVAWQGALALELVFNWPGVGWLLIKAVNSFNTPLILGVVVVFAYLLAITVFVLDFIYALIDPRVRLEGLRQETNATTGAPRGLFARLRGWFSRRHRLPVPQRWKRPAPPAPTRQFLTWRQGREPPIPSQEISIPRRVVLRQAGKPTGAAPLQVHPLPLVGKKTKASWRWSQFRTTWREFWRYPSALVGLAIILIMLGISLYTIISVPRQEMLMAWRSQSEEGYSTYWYQNPEFAMPAWTNWFRVNKLPETFYLDSDSPNAVRTEEVNIEKGTTTLTLRFPFEYTYGDFPQDVVIFLRTEYKEKQPFVLLNWVTPDLRRVDLGGFAAFSRQAYYLSRQTRLERKLNGLPVKQGLFYDPTLSTPTPLKGTYLLEMKVLFFEPIGNFRAETLIYGKVFGWGGTDLHRRDLALGLLWGAPVALAFGFLGAVLSNVLAMFLAALGAWFGGWLDGLVQRLVEVNMIIPSLPVAILVYLMYSKSIWAVLGVMVLLNIFGSAIKNYRAVFLQIKEAPYIEAARTYGASHMRIIFTYLTPRILPVLIPALVVMVPGYVYLETTLAFLGVTDPYVPTWGKIIFDAMANRALEEYPYWLLEPMALLILTSLAFSLVGLALERIYNPRLRKE